MGFAQVATDGGAVDVTPSSEGVLQLAEIRLSFSAFLDPDTITPEAIVLRSGDLDRATTLRWDFQSGSDFPPASGEPPVQVVAIRPLTPMADRNQYRVIVTEKLRGLLGERIEPFEGLFSTSADAGFALPAEPPEELLPLASQIEGGTWRQETGCAVADGEPVPPECRASCGWPQGACHRLLPDDIDPSVAAFRFTDPAMDLVLCNLDSEGHCTMTFDVAPPFKDLYDFSYEWPTWHIVEPGAPERSYIVYKVLGVPGIDGGPMPRRYDARDQEPFLYHGDRTVFTDTIARRLRDWIAAGAVPK